MLVARWLLPLVCTFTLLMAGPTPARGQATPFPAKPLLDAALKEGPVNLYGGVGLPVLEDLAQTFKAKTGITVQVTRSGSEKLFQRVIQEFDAGVSAADVIMTADEGHFVHFKTKGILARHVSSLDGRVPAEFKEPEAYYYRPFGYRYGIAYNPGAVAPSDVPRTYAALADRKYKGRLVHPHPGYSGGAMHMVFLLRKQLGRDYYRALAANEPMIVQSILDVRTHVISRERPIAAASIYYDVFQAKQKGNPIEFIFPAGRVIFVSTPAAVLKQAPHPNAARLFLDFLLSPDGQQVLASHGLDVFDPQVKYPAGLIPLDPKSVWRADAEEVLKEIEDIKRMWREFFGV